MMELTPNFWMKHQSKAPSFAEGWSASLAGEQPQIGSIEKLKSKPWHQLPHEDVKVKMNNKRSPFAKFRKAVSIDSC